jgi:hypothetical protein
MHRPVTEAVPKIPPRNPVLLVDVGLILAQRVVVLRMRGRIVNDSQNLSVLRCLRDLIPLEWGLSRGVQPRLISQVCCIAAQTIPGVLCFLLHEALKSAVHRSKKDS